MRYIFFSILFLLPLILLAQADPADIERAHFRHQREHGMESVASNDYDVQYYRCTWNVNPSVRAISGSVMMYFKAVTTTSSIILDLHQALVVDSIRYRNAGSNYVQGTNKSLKVNFPAPIAAGQRDSIEIFYHGTPPSTAYFITTTHTGTPVLYSQSESYGASTWWPCKDVLNDKADSVDILLTYPSSFSSSSNGLAVQETTNGTNKTTWWKHRYAIAPYLVAIAVTNYTMVNDAVTLPTRTMPLALHAYPESAAAFQNSLNTAKFCLQQFGPLISEYPFVKERYAITQWNIGGGMEHQTNSFMGSTGSSLSAHELAHQWFGDKVTCRSWSDIWLNEGFASYMEFQYMELTAPANRISFLQSWINTITTSPSGSVYILPADTLNETRIFDNRLSYKKGGYLAVMLRGKLGDSTFYRGIRRYLNDPTLAYGTALTADLQRNLELESGQSLTEFFNDWFYGQGYPNYTATWSSAGAGNVQLQLNQTQSHSSVSFFEMPVPLQFKDATHDTTITVNHTSSGQLFNLTPGFVPDTVIIDPRLWILSKTKLATRNTTATAVSDLEWNNGLQLFPNPASDYLNLVLPDATAGTVSYRIVNEQGQLIAAGNLPGTGNRRRLNLHHAAHGTYWIELTTKQKLVARKTLFLMP
jgi:aminopeptidase N